ncbi:hypothetical protein ABT026_18770 [Streptomyces sp. NPDC002734]|uniref:hypothetical protein n=1 Tax=Streptomyces sp. NPDC002734 TaxID=3154426 RepID=UPI003330E1EC
MADRLEGGKLWRGENLPSRVAEVFGAAEFLAVPVDGRGLCAAAVEVDGHRVVVHGFPGPRKPQTSAFPCD